MGKAFPYRGMTDDMEHRTVYGWLTEDMGYPEIICTGGVREPVLSTTVERFTGLNDRDGNPVYTGDFLNYNGINWQITDDVTHFSMSIVGISGTCISPLRDIEKMTVIGNQWNRNLFEVLSKKNFGIEFESEHTA